MLNPWEPPGTKGNALLAGPNQPQGPRPGPPANPKPQSPGRLVPLFIPAFWGSKPVLIGDFGAFHGEVEERAVAGLLQRRPRGIPMASQLPWWSVSQGRGPNFPSIPSRFLRTPAPLIACEPGPESAPRQVNSRGSPSLPTSVSGSAACHQGSGKRAPPAGFRPTKEMSFENGTSAQIRGTH